MVTSTDQPNIHEAEVYGPLEPPYTSQVCTIEFIPGPPLFPRSYAEAKRWAGCRVRLKLGRFHTLERVPSGYVVRDKGQSVAGWLAPPEDVVDQKERGRPRIKRNG